jgi:type II secretory pathway predicted ATPase ExeA
MGRMRTPRDWRKGRGRAGRAEAKGDRGREGRSGSAGSLQPGNSQRMGRRWLVAFLDADEPQPITGLVGSGVPLRDPPKKVYMNSATRRISALLVSLIGTQAGLFLITGGRGLGKSHLVRWLAQKLRDAGHLVMVVDHPGLALDRQLQTLSVEMRLPPPAKDMASWFRRVGEALALGEGATAPVLLMDDADLAGDGALLGLLPLLDTPADCLCGIRIVLAGRPSLAKRFDLPAFAKLKQHLVSHGQLEPFDERDIASFIRDQTTTLKGAERASDDATAAIARHAGGLPGDAAFLWTRAIRLARDDGERTPSREHVERAARMLHPSLRHAAQRQPIEQIPGDAVAESKAASRPGLGARRYEGKEGRRMEGPQRGAVRASVQCSEMALQSPRVLRRSRSGQDITGWTLSGLATAAALIALVSIGSVVDSVWYGSVPTSRVDTAENTLQGTENTLQGSDGEARTTMRTESDGVAGPASIGPSTLAALPSNDIASQSGNGASAADDKARPDEAPRDERQSAQSMASTGITAIQPPADTEVAHENGDQVALASPPPPQAQYSSPVEDRSGMKSASSVERKHEPGYVPEKRVQTAAKHKADRMLVARHELPSPDPTSRQPLSSHAASRASASVPQQNRPAVNTVELASTSPPTPGDSVRAAGGSQCQSYSSNVNIALRDMHVNGVACRGEDGRWWLMNQHSG